MIESIAMQQAVLAQNVTMAMVKSNADSQRQIGDMLAQLVDQVPVSGTRGQALNITA